MITMRAFYAAAAIALAAMLALAPLAATAQNDPPKETKEPKKKTPKKKGEEDKKKGGDDEPKEKKEKKKPAKVPSPGGGQPVLLGQYGDWGAYTASGRKVCYALAKPTSSQTEPAGKPRDPTFMFISTRPADKVTNEVSLVLGFPAKAGSDMTVDLGSAKFAMYTQGDGAWIKDQKEEARMVETMRKTSEMVITGESGKGTKSTDKYSLRGLSQALDRVAQECK